MTANRRRGAKKERFFFPVSELRGWEGAEEKVVLTSLGSVFWKYGDTRKDVEIYAKSQAANEKRGGQLEHSFLPPSLSSPIQQPPSLLQSSEGSARDM